MVGISSLCCCWLMVVLMFFIRVCSVGSRLVSGVIVLFF